MLLIIFQGFYLIEIHVQRLIHTLEVDQSLSDVYRDLNIRILHVLISQESGISFKNKCASDSRPRENKASGGTNRLQREIAI